MTLVGQGNKEEGVELKSKGGRLKTVL